VGLHGRGGAPLTTVPGRPGPIDGHVLVPVFREPEAVFRRALASVRAERPHEIVAIVDGGDAAVAAVAADYCDRVLRLPNVAHARNVRFAWSVNPNLYESEHTWRRGLSPYWPGSRYVGAVGSTMIDFGGAKSYPVERFTPRLRQALVDPMGVFSANTSTSPAGADGAVCGDDGPGDGQEQRGSQHA
jgi:hypothetical protein